MERQIPAGNIAKSAGLAAKGPLRIRLTGQEQLVHMLCGETNVPRVETSEQAATVIS